jgi:CRP/FNR family cyclic AMP-dependent transcriptional regulator
MSAEKTNPQPPLAHIDEATLKARVPQGIVRSFKAGVTIITEGEDSDSLYIILSGQVQVYISDERGKEVVLNSLQVGDYFGEFVLYGGTRTASVMAEVDTRVLVVPRHAVDELIANNPEFTRHLLENLIKKVRSLSSKVRDFALRDVYGRLVVFFDENGIKNADGLIGLTESFTHQEIASRIGTSREMVGRILKDLVSNGYVQVTDRRITVLKPLPARWQ